MMTKVAQLSVVIAILVIAGHVSVGAATQPGLTAVMLVNVANYAGVTYAAHPLPNSTYVFYPGEPIELSIVIVNRGEDPIRLSTSAAAIGDNFSAKRLDGSPITLSFEPDVRLRRIGETPSPVSWGPDIQLDAHEALMFSAHLAGPALAPGEYAIEIDSVMKEGDGKKLAPQASRIYFELRSSSPETQTEEVARRAARAIMARDYASAELHVGTLTKLHPQSYLAHAFRAQIHEARGNQQAAITAYAQALSILEKDGDEMFNRTSTPDIRRQMVQSLRARLSPR